MRGFMKTLKIINITFLFIIACTLASIAANAQDPDVTMDVVKDSDAGDVTDRIMDRIDMTQTGRYAHMDEDLEPHHEQARGGTHMDTDASDPDGVRMHGDTQDSQDGGGMMREDMHNAQDDSRMMREDMHDAQDDR